MLKCEAHDAVEIQIADLKNDQIRQWDIIDKIHDRLPIWAVITLSVLTGMLGLLVGIKI